MDGNKRKKIVALIVVITILLIAYQFNSMLYNSFITNYHFRKKKLLNLLINVSTSIRGRYRRERKPKTYWVAPGRTRAWWDNFISGTMLQNEWRNNFRIIFTNSVKSFDHLL